MSFGSMPSAGFETASGSQQEAAGPGESGPDNIVGAAFKLQAEEGATVTATFPFFGDPEGGQLTFQIGDHIKVLEKDVLWSWGKLEKTGDDGWFPHNYVQASFKPLPGMHELKQRILIKKAREEAIARGEDPDLAEALILNGGVPPAAPVEVEQPVQQQTTGLEGGKKGLGISADGWDWGSMGMGMEAMVPAPVSTQPQDNEINNGVGWGNGAQGGDPDLFSMWMEDLGEGQSSDLDDTESIVSASSSDLERRRKERKNIARELLDTEDKYVRMLEALLATIIRPCLGQGTNKTSPLPKDEANELFGTLRAEEILAINTAFREQLRGRMATLSDETCFGDLFKRFAPFLKMYVEYCTQHENTASRVSLIASKSDKFSNLLHRARSDPRCQDLDAQSLLIMPIQRIPRYKLLLEGMLKNTEKDHPDRPLLQNAIEQISDVASFINDSIKRRENQAKIWDLQSMLTEPIDLAKATRIFIRSGVLTKLGRRYQDREDFFALFNDGLLHAKPATFGTKYVFKRIDSVMQVENVGFLKDKPKALHAFRIVTKGHIYLLSAKSAGLKKEWMKVLDLCIRGGKRETILQGPLRVLRVGKEAAVRLEYFYIFNDVVVRGKALWRGKFKHKETMTVTRVEANVEMDARFEALLPKEITARMAEEDVFRIIHKRGSLIVMAKSETDKAVWISSLEHQMNLNKSPQLGTVTASNRIIHEENFANQDNSSHGSHGSHGSSSTLGAAADASASQSNWSTIGNAVGGKPSEQQRRAYAASTLGVGRVDGGGARRKMGGRMGVSGSNAKDRRNTTDGSPQKPSSLATTSDLLVSLESSDEEGDLPSSTVGQHRYQQQQQQYQQTARRQTTEGQVSPPKRGGSGGTATVPANGGGGGGQSLLDRDLMAVFGTPKPPSSSFQQPLPVQQQHQQQQQQQQQGKMRPSSSMTTFGGASDGISGGGGGGGSMTPSSSSSSLPVLQPPTRDTPSYKRTAYTGRAGGPGSPQKLDTAMVLHGGGGGGQVMAHQLVPPGAVAFSRGGGVSGGTQRSSTSTGFDQFQVQGQFTRPQHSMQGQLERRQQGYEIQQQGNFSNMSAPQQQMTSFAGNAAQAGGMYHQQQFQQGFAPQETAQFAPQPQQQNHQHMREQQQFQGYRQQQQQHQQQQQMHQQYQGF